MTFENPASTRLERSRARLRNALHEVEAHADDASTSNTVIDLIGAALTSELLPGAKTSDSSRNTLFALARIGIANALPALRTLPARSPYALVGGAAARGAMSTFVHRARVRNAVVDTMTGLVKTVLAGLDVEMLLALMQAVRTADTREATTRHAPPG